MAPDGGHSLWSGHALVARQRKASLAQLMRLCWKTYFLVGTNPARHLPASPIDLSKMDPSSAHFVSIAEAAALSTAPNVS